MCARVLARFLRCNFHDNLCIVLDEYVRAEVSLDNLKFAKKLVRLWNRAALSHEAVGE